MTMITYRRRHDGITLVFDDSKCDFYNWQMLGDLKTSTDESTNLHASDCSLPGAHFSEMMYFF